MRVFQMATSYQCLISGIRQHTSLLEKASKGDLRKGMGVIAFPPPKQTPEGFLLFLFWGVGRFYCCWLKLSRRQRLQKSCRCLHHSPLAQAAVKTVRHLGAHTGASELVLYQPQPFAVGHYRGLWKPGSERRGQRGPLRLGTRLDTSSNLLRTQMAGGTAWP